MNFQVEGICTQILNFEISRRRLVPLSAQLQAGAEFFPRAISCTQATQTDSINSIASAG